MSYSIYIGEASIEVQDDGAIVARVPKVSLTGDSNGRHPGYGQWYEFTTLVGLRDLFWDKEDGLMREHPGIFVLRPAHLTRVRAALDAYQVKHPDAKPGFLDGQDMLLPRLLWLEFWIDRALRTCEVPAIYNS